MNYWEAIIFERARDDVHGLLKDFDCLFHRTGFDVHQKVGLRTVTGMDNQYDVGWLDLRDQRIHGVEVRRIDARRQLGEVAADGNSIKREQLSLLAQNDERANRGGKVEQFGTSVRHIFVCPPAWVAAIAFAPSATGQL